MGVAVGRNLFEFINTGDRVRLEADNGDRVEGVVESVKRGPGWGNLYLTIGGRTVRFYEDGWDAVTILRHANDKTTTV